MRSDKGQLAGETKNAASESFALIRRYVVQETLGPFKSLGRTLAFGVAGALLLGVGTIVLLLAVLRVLQSETGSTFAGTWSFAPYLLSAVAALVAAGLAGVIGWRGSRRSAGKQGDRHE